MTDVLSTALAHDGLEPFEGLDVVEAGIEIPGAAGGLQDAMKFAPMSFHQGDEVFVVLRCQTKKVRFEPIVKDQLDGDQRRVHVFNVTEATFVEGEVVADALDRMRTLIEEGKAKLEAEKGIQRIPFGGSDDEAEFELAAKHAMGEHAAERVDECPVCREEIDAEEREAAEDAEREGGSGND